MGGGIPFGCGRCLPCRLSRRRQWTWRQYFEALQHDENCFLTLTYSDDKLPPGGSLCKEHHTLWLKRFRKAIAPRQIRYFMVGEYGDETLRPHYHYSLFGIGVSTLMASGHIKLTGYDKHGKPLYRMASWPYGNVWPEEFSDLTAQYVAGYTVKKMTSVGDARLNGRTPEFARMSLRPAIGSLAMSRLGQLLSGFDGMHSIERDGDVPRFLRVGNRKVYLGRFLLRKLREAVGFTDEYISELKGKASSEKAVELLALLQSAVDASPLAPITSKQVYAKEVAQKILNMEARSKIYRKRGSL